MGTKEGKRDKVLVINLTNGEIALYRKKQDAAGKIGVHRNSLVGPWVRKTFGDYLIIMIQEQ